MTPTPGRIIDIRTKRAIGSTADLTTTFIDQIANLHKADKQVFVVVGPCRMLDSRHAINLLREHGVTVVLERQFPADTLWLLEGEPHELGFKVA